MQPLAEPQTSAPPHPLAPPHNLSRPHALAGAHGLAEPERTTRAQPLSGGVMLLGSFDGFHLGHRRLRDHAQKMQAPGGVWVLQCAPHPRQFFGREVRMRISTGQAQLACLREAGLSRICAPRFDAAFAALSPAQFARDYLCARYGVAAVVVGRDFRFGHQRRGDLALLRALGAELGFAVAALDLLPQGAAPISSSRIRAHLRAGEIAQACALLGHDWRIEAFVQGGRLRFDPDQLLPPAGAYHAQACDLNGVALGGVRFVLDPALAQGFCATPLPDGPLLLAFDGRIYTKEDHDARQGQTSERATLS